MKLRNKLAFTESFGGEKKINQLLQNGECVIANNIYLKPHRIDSKVGVYALEYYLSFNT